MHVAVVFYAIAPEGGGAFTFQQSILAALRELEPSSRHRFTYYAAAAGGLPPDVIAIPASRRRVYARRGIELSRAMQDRLDASRRPWETWLEKSLREREVEFVWFASHHVEQCNQPYMCTVWDLAHLEYPFFPEVGAHGEWERRQHYFGRYLPKAARVVIPNEAGEETLVRGYAVGRDRVVRQPLPTSSFALDPPDAGGDASLLAEWQLEAGSYLFYPAQFWAHKNHTTGLAALAHLRSSGQTARPFVVVGSDKGQLEHVRDVARRVRVDDLLVVLGFVSERELVALYRNAYALLYLSFFGPENLPPLEALALGTPVICADVPGMREQLGEAVVFVPPTDAEAIAGAIEQIADPALRATLLERGRALATSRTPRRYVEGILEVFDAFEPIRATWGPSYGPPR